MTSSITQTPTWQALKAHQQTLAALSLSELFAEQPQRFEQFSVSAAGLLLDYSKNYITTATLGLLQQLTAKTQLSHQIEDLFTGKLVNTTEQRPALHTALRSLDTKPLYINGQNIVTEIQQTLAKMTAICAQIHNQEWRGYSNKPITDIVNIGIGGSDLGPAMVVEALTPYHLPQLKCHFVSNLDPSAIEQTLARLNPETTLFIIASKSFTTTETLLNAQIAKDWLLQASALPFAKLSQHFLAISANFSAVTAFGIDAAKHLPLWDWVGGRYSLWSAIGLPIALAVGMANFKALLAGAEEMDTHFRTAPFAQNMPVILGLLGIWYIDFFAAQTLAVLPYAEHLKLLPAYLQQLDMESNGKSMRHQGIPVDYKTGAILWGNAGSNSQHAFHQLFHQGTHLVPIDFIVAVTSHSPRQSQQALLYANCLSQSRALMIGKTQAEVLADVTDEKHTLASQQLAAHKCLPGNRPSNTLIMPKLTPNTLGALIALYEHKVFVQSVIWDINPFDQWGITLGKQLAEPIFTVLQQNALAQAENFDSSTKGLINHFQRINQKTLKKVLPNSGSSAKTT